jgi:hypothetical protein
MYFAWSPLDIGLSITKFNFLFTRATKAGFLIHTLLTLVDKQKKLLSIQH